MEKEAGQSFESEEDDTEIYRARNDNSYIVGLSTNPDEPVNDAEMWQRLNTGEPAEKDSEGKAKEAALNLRID